MGIFDFFRKKRNNEEDDFDERFAELFSKAFDAASKNAEKIAPVILKNQRVWEANYGLDESNPIISESLQDTEEYLKNLRTPQWKSFKWSGYTSIRATVHGLQDVGEDRYTLYLDGKPYTNLYFVPYIERADFPPAGICFWSDDRDWDEARLAAKRAKEVGPILLKNQRVWEANYGLDESNPIISGSLHDILSYMDRLCNCDCKVFTWGARSIKRATVHGQPDVGLEKYTLYLDALEEVPYTDIYFVPFVEKAEFPPAGLHFWDDNRDWDKERLAVKNANELGIDRETGKT